MRQKPSSILKSYHQVLFWKVIWMQQGFFVPLHLYITDQWALQSSLSVSGLLHSCSWVKLPQGQRGRLNLILILLSSQQITNYQGEYIQHTMAFLVPGNYIFFFSVGNISQRLSVFMGFSCKYSFVNILFWDKLCFPLLLLAFLVQW